MKKWLAIGIILLFVGTCFIPAIAQDTKKPLPTSRGNWLYVGGSGPGNYTKIQDAIDNASDGDTVFVYDDSSPYYEFIGIHKSISLIGEERTTTIVEDINNDYAGTIQVEGNSVIIKSLTIQNNKVEDEGILISYSNNVTITDLNIETRGNGITLYNCNNISINFVTIISCDWYGIQFCGSSFNTITNCNLISNLRGIYVQNDYLSNNNLIYHNNFINNTENARDCGSNIWNNSYPLGGNHWSDYTGIDNDSDGIGDTPYTISGTGGNQDHYPLMLPYDITKLSIRIQPKNFKLLLFIKNVGNTTAFTVKWNMTIDGFVLFGKNASGSASRPLLPEQEILYTSNKLFIGLGRIEITATAWADNAPVVTAKMNGILILWFFRIIGG